MIHQQICITPGCKPDERTHHLFYRPDCKDAFGIFIILIILTDIENHKWNQQDSWWNCEIAAGHRYPGSLDQFGSVGVMTCTDLQH